MTMRQTLIQELQRDEGFRQQCEKRTADITFIHGQIIHRLGEIEEALKTLKEQQVERNGEEGQ